MKYQIARLGLVWLVIAASPKVYAKHPDFDRIDQHARSAPARVTNDLHQLATYLSQPAANDREKVRSFYVWITNNIAYDVQAFRQYRPGRYEKVRPEEVLKKRKAVCQGYAELFQALCQRKGIACYVVPGYSKGGYSENRDFSRGDHAWNAVKIDEQWYLLDVTWGSGGLNDQLEFVKKFDEAYFLSDPAVFVQHHLPLDPVWQLLDCPVDMESFVTGKVTASSGASSDCPPVRSPDQVLREVGLEAQVLASAQRAYDFNPANVLPLVHAYMNRAHELMSRIPAQLRNRSEIEDAMRTQEEALTYLKQAQKFVSETKKGEAVAEKNMLEANLVNSENNLKGMRAALKQ